MLPYCERKLGGSEGDLGPPRSVCSSPSDTVSSSRALAWCRDPRLTGTFAINVVTPSATCSAADAATQQHAIVQLLQKLHWQHKHVPACCQTSRESIHHKLLL